MQCLFDFILQKGGEAIHYASGHGHFHIVQFLVARGADVNLTTEVRKVRVSCFQT